MTARQVEHQTLLAEEDLDSLDAAVAPREPVGHAPLALDGDGTLRQRLRERPGEHLGVDLQVGGVPAQCGRQQLDGVRLPDGLERYGVVWRGHRGASRGVWLLQVC